jgi:ribulose-phosphate 3-epimerase
MKIKVAPSILSADFSCLDKEIRRVARAGADMLHIDVMDGNFVPNITIGPCVIKDVRRITKLPLDVHLMISHPEKFVDDFTSAGSDMITMHIETISVNNFKLLASRLRAKNIKVGISLNPSTPLKRIKSVLGSVDLVLVMSVNPGFSGQKFIPSVLTKIKELRSIYTGDISVDGGVNEKVAGELIRAGANILVSGAYIFGAKNTMLVMERIRNAR